MYIPIGESYHIEPVNKTNGDRIRHMNDDELAEFLCDFTVNTEDDFKRMCYDCNKNCNCDRDDCGNSYGNYACPHALRWWLKQEAKK